MLSVALLLLGQEKVLNYDILRGGKAIGSAKVAIKLTADGGKRSDSKLELTSNGQKLDMHTTQLWAKSGRPLLKVVLTFDSKGVESSRVRVDFHASDLLVTETVGSKITKTTKAIPASAEIRDLPEFWFLRDVPTKGKPYKYMVFNATTLEWETATSTYIGETEKNIKGTVTKLQSISQQIGSRKLEILLNQEGIPVDSTTNDGIRIVAKF